MEESDGGMVFVACVGCERTTVVLYSLSESP